MPHRKFLHRIQAEFLEMPGLQLTIAQAQRLYGLDRTVCAAALDALVDANFLRVRDGRYSRVSDGAHQHDKHPAVEKISDRDRHEPTTEETPLRARQQRRRATG
jgi:hypothetical protein